MFGRCAQADEAIWRRRFRAARPNCPGPSLGCDKRTLRSQCLRRGTTCFTGTSKAMVGSDTPVGTRDCSRLRLKAAILLLVVPLGVLLGCMAASHAAKAPCAGLPGPCGAPPPPVPVHFTMSANGQLATTVTGPIIGSNDHLDISSSQPTRIAISIEVPRGSTLDDLEIGTGQHGWGIDRGGPTGVDTLLLKSPSKYGSGTHQFVMTLSSQPVGTQNVFAYYHATPQPHSGQGDGWTVVQIGIFTTHL